MTSSISTSPCSKMASSPMRSIRRSRAAPPIFQQPAMRGASLTRRCSAPPGVRASPVSVITSTPARGCLICSMSWRPPARSRCCRCNGINRRFPRMACAAHKAMSTLFSTTWTARRWRPVPTARRSWSARNRGSPTTSAAMRWNCR